MCLAGVVFGPWHEEEDEEEEGGGGDFELPPNGSQLHAQAETPSRPKRKRRAKLDPAVGVDREAARIPFVSLPVARDAAGYAGATDFREASCRL